MSSFVRLIVWVFVFHNSGEHRVFLHRYDVLSSLDRNQSVDLSPCRRWWTWVAWMQGSSLESER